MNSNMDDLITKFFTEEINELHRQVDFIKDFNVQHILTGYRINLIINEQRYIMYKLTNKSIEELINSQFLRLVRSNYIVELILTMEDN
jgi:hypothetical protein